MENFFEKTKLKIRIRKLFREPLPILLANIPQISGQEIIKFQEIYFEVFAPNPPTYRHHSMPLAGIFPAFLSVLDGDLSEDRIKMLAKIVIEVAEERLVNFGDPDDFDGDSA